MKKIGLFLDDERVVSDVTWVKYDEDIEWTVVRNEWDFFRQFGLGGVDCISFDHDIQRFTVDGVEITGYDILKEMVDMFLEDGKPIPQCFFHTQNPVGKKNMECYYQNALAHQAKY